MVHTSEDLPMHLKNTDNVKAGYHQWNLISLFIRRIKDPLIMNGTTANNRKMKMKTKAMTITAIIVIATIIALPLAANETAFATTDPNGSTSVAGSAMLKLTSPNTPVRIPLLKGLYDSKDVMFITTEVSDKTMKDQIGNFTGSPVNYAAI